MPSRRLLHLILLLIWAVPSLVVAADPTAVIDTTIQAAWDETGITPAPECTDRQLIRRMYLDLAGRIPTPQEVSAYLANKEPNKHSATVEHLLLSEDYVRHFTDTFDTLLMGRGAKNQYDQRNAQQWRSWLERVFRDNQPWNQVVSDILLARPDSQADRGVVWFLYERNNDHQKIAEAIAPAFFGIRIECAQCHDHMIASEIEQAHYWGLVAFFNRGSNTRTKNGPRVAESAIGGFSEFANLEGTSSPNLLTFFKADTIEESRPAAGEKQEDADDLYVPASLDSDPRVPAFSRRAEFVQNIAADHPLIARAFVNRVWAILMGRGIVHPFDEMDSTHPPSHPELLNQLADDFRNSGYDIRRLIRSITLSRPYRLSSRRPAGIDDPATFAWALEKPLTAEQLTRSISVAVQGTTEVNLQQHPLTVSVRDRMPDVLPEENVTGVKTALFLSNNPALNQFIANSTDPQHLTARLVQLPSDDQRIDLLFQTIFGRSATADERATLKDYIQADKERLSDRLQQITWSMLTSAEFRFNH